MYGISFVAAAGCILPPLLLLACWIKLFCMYFLELVFVVNCKVDEMLDENLCNLMNSYDMLFGWKHNIIYLMCCTIICFMGCVYVLYV
jgi:hypothetical protein